MYQYFILLYCQKNSIVWIDHILFSYLSVDRPLDCFYFVAIMVIIAMDYLMYKFLFGHMFSILLVIYIGRQLLDYMVTLCLTF